MKILYFFIISLTTVCCDEFTHTYKDGEQVSLWMNAKVGPYYNRQRAYSHFSLPFCVSTEVTTHQPYKVTLLEALQGVDIAFSGFHIPYKDKILPHQYCAIEMNEQFYKTFAHAIENNYWNQMYMDDLPVLVPVGEIEGDNYYICTHKKFDIGYNGNRIVEVNLTAANKRRLSPYVVYPFSYEVNWKESSIKYDDRLDKYLDPTSFQLSTFNIFMMVILIVALVWTLVQILCKNCARHSNDDIHDLEKDLGYECEQKPVPGDEFHPVPHEGLLSAECQNSAKP